MCVRGQEGESEREEGFTFVFTFSVSGGKRSYFRLLGQLKAREREVLERAACVFFLSLSLSVICLSPVRPQWNIPRGEVIYGGASMIAFRAFCEFAIAHEREMV